MAAVAIVALATLAAQVEQGGARMTQIMIDVRPETLQHIHAMLGMAEHRTDTFAKLAGRMLDAQVAYRLEVARMRDGVREANPQYVEETWL